MSFYEEGQQTRVRTPPPRRRARGSGSGPSDPKTLMVRRALALGVGVLVVILLVVTVRGCLDSRRHQALRAYSRDVSAVVEESDTQVAKPFFSLLGNSAARPVEDVALAVDNYKDTAEHEARRAKSLSVPGDLDGAQRNLLLALDLRAEALAKVAGAVRTARGARDPSSADAVIAGEVELLLASDVIYSQRVRPLIQQTLAASAIHDSDPAPSQFVTDLGWLSPATVGSRLAGSTSPSGTPNGTVAPGTHGHRLVSVTAGSTTLAPAPTVNHLPGTGNTTFTVKLTNVGSNDETNVRVGLVIRGSGAPITQSKTIDRTRAGSTASVDIPLSGPPPQGVPVTIQASVAGVPGEKTLTHNRQTFTAIFGG